MPIVVTPIPGAFVGEVVGVDCAAPLTAADVGDIDAAMDRHAVLVFRDQPLTDEQQLAFTRQFGALEHYETPGHIRKREEERLVGGIADFSNLTRDGKIMSPQDRIWLFKLADRLWHSDSSFRPIPAKYSLLSGRTIPSRGGDTEFADMRAAFEALDDETKIGMPAKRELSMRQLRHLLRLHHGGVSAREIGRLLGVARSAVQEYLKPATAAGLAWPLAEDVTDEVLEQQLFGRAGVATGQRRRVEPEWADLARELKRPGVTMTILWEEYRDVHPEGYGYSRSAICFAGLSDA
jgi:alpha-ketoglutarate-dependent taurine dioxygenase